MTDQSRHLGCWPARHPGCWPARHLGCWPAAILDADLPAILDADLPANLDADQPAILDDDQPVILDDDQPISHFTGKNTGQWPLGMIRGWFGEGNGTPLQPSCLENLMHGGAWWAAVHGVAKSRTRLSDFTFTFHFHALEKEMATHSSVLAWRIPGTAEPGGLRSMGTHRVDTTEAT